ncbi:MULTISPECIES: protein-tyrosine phosphatase family protein [Actinokineospora]|uniref:Protein-tyrosine-phosphatase n=1 Tax=Actinokineospora fastidiosa TaxID=1816 RepID=A0A918LEQ0_9PSEU|nr:MULTISPECIES: protein-tyrosine phosphatase family protein [Actinokineospora]UVS80793.1 Protein tyrosine phosphatase [Actinokineospora sp. UTMC 2448]GGS37220.1 protein-tyrosine-phosphatase [Actinokineospora fastidiosa]
MLDNAIQLPDGAWVRGRGLRRPEPGGEPPEYGLYLGNGKLRQYKPDWEHAWVDWPDFFVPRDFRTAVTLIRDLHARAKAGARVEVACGGGVGRTGTAVSCLAVLAGVPAQDAVAWTRAHLHPRAVEMPWQHRWIRRFAKTV